jgi:hypothetical protein
MNVLQISEDGRYWCYIRGQEEPKLYRETVSDGHVEREEDILEIPLLPGYYSFFLARDGICLISNDKPITLTCCDFATRKLKDLFAAGKNVGSGFCVSSNGRNCASRSTFRQSSGHHACGA